MFDARALRDEQEHREDACARPSREELWQRWLDGTYTLDEYGEAMNACYPLSDAEIAAHLMQQRDGAA